MKLKLSFLLLFVTAGVVIYFWKPIYARIEGTPPEIKLTSQPKGAGVAPLSIGVVATDEAGGLKEVRVAIRQADNVKELLVESGLNGTNEYQKSLELPLAGAGLKDGQAEVVIDVVDNSWRENQSQTVFPVLIDFASPRISVESLQHVAQQGGVEFVVIKASDPTLTEVGVEVGDKRFKGIPLREFDARFAERIDLYGVLFAIPADWDTTAGKIRGYATDLAGNKTLAAISFPITQVKRSNTNPKINRAFLERKVPELLPGYFALSGTPPQQVGTSDQELLQQFRIINEEYRKLLDAKLAQILAPTTPKRYWTAGALLKPMPSATSSNFSEKRNWLFDGIDAGFSVHNGLDLASVRQDTVRSAESGKIVFEGDFGIYGNTVVIDHGLGLYSIYSHLSSISVSAGDEVARGAEIGKTGDTGLAGGDHLHFEFRVNDTPVTPTEWWDGKWINDNVDGKLAALLPPDQPPAH